MSRTVIKLGGSILIDAGLRQKQIQQIAALAKTDGELILVHGGGKEIGQIQTALGGEPRFVAGLRVSDATAMAAAEMVLAGAVNTRLSTSSMSIRAANCGMADNCTSPSAFATR